MTALFSKIHLQQLQNIFQKCLASQASNACFPVVNLESHNAQISSRDPLSLTHVTKYSRLEQMYKTALSVAYEGGGAKAIERHTKQHKKMVVEDRIKALVDQGSNFLELSPLAGFSMEYGTVSRAGILTGIGQVSGKLCMILANDGAVKGGSVYPITIRKQLRAQEIAEQNRLPCIYVVDSGGAFLPLQSDIFPDKNQGGRAFYNEAVMSAAQIPQIAVVCGSCTAGGAYIPTMADEAIIVHKAGSVFLGGPPLVKAALGEIVSAEDLGGATLHCSISGCTDYLAPDEKSAFETCRSIVASLNVHPKEVKDRLPPALPLYDPAELSSLIPDTDQHKLDMYQVIGRLVDGSCFHEFKKLFGPTLLTGFAHIDGYIVGIIGNQGELTANAASKGTHFITMCNERHIPLVFLQNTSPELHTKDQARTADQLKCQARLMAAVSCSRVPKITVVVGNAVGPTYYMLAGKCMSPNFLFSWPNAVRCAESLDLVLDAVKSDLSTVALEDTKKKDLIEKYTEKISVETTAIFASSRMWDDGIILPQDTRQVLSQCLEIVSAYTSSTAPENPVFPVKNGVSISFHKLHDWPLVLTKTDDVNQKQMDPTVTHLDHSVLKTSI